jgi:hypothetical protein
MLLNLNICGNTINLKRIQSMFRDFHLIDLGDVDVTITPSFLSSKRPLPSLKANPLIKTWSINPSINGDNDSHLLGEIIQIC